VPIITSSKTQAEYDVVIVGSGAGGGQMAYTLTLAGMRCVMLEAGRNYDVGAETPMFQTPDKAPLRGMATPEKEFGFYNATVGGGWQVPGEPYRSASEKKEEQFWWWRSRMMGGRTNHWTRITLRNGPYDFKARERDGLGFDWPISYEDLEPFYTKVEMLIGVYGANCGLENAPDSPEGVLLPPPKGRIAELLAQKYGRAMGIPFIPIRRAILTKAQDWENIPRKLHPGNVRAQRIVAEAMRGRSACLYATDCGRGCAVRANYQSTTVHLPPALETGNLDIVSNAHVREVEVGPDGRATGVVYIDKITGREERVKGKLVVLAASSGETVRILLNSNGEKGVANSSGLVGKYIMDTVGTTVDGQIPMLENMPPHNEDGTGGPHFYAPWWLYQEAKAGKLDFPRGYHVEAGATRTMPTGEFMVPGFAPARTYGTKFKEAARRYYGSFVGYCARGEMIPNDDCFCEIDPELKDQWGIPALRWHWKWGENELRQVAHARRTLGEMIESMGGTVNFLKEEEAKDYIAPGGSMIHEVGGAIMGAEAKRSVCNGWNQTWDVKNLFVCDGSPFPGNADKNPTLTLMALAWRAGEYIVDEARKGNF
jgi:choline dehydrogenase-like flavoprotein